MAYEVIVPDNAEKDIDEAILWYEEQQKDLGKRFYSVVLERLKKLEINPEYYSYIHTDYRRITVDPFPFNIVYKIYGSTVVVLAILHQSRNPAELLKRIK